ncbi:hypothetical protein D1872_51100 [compost metagenome]
MTIEELYDAKDKLMYKLSQVNRQIAKIQKECSHPDYDRKWVDPSSNLTQSTGFWDCECKTCKHKWAERS